MIVNQQQDGSVLVITLNGRLDSGTVTQVDEALTRALDAAPAILLDLAELGYVNSAGLRILLKAAKQAKSRQVRLALAAMQPVVQNVFEVSGFLTIFSVYPDRGEALGQLR